MKGFLRSKFCMTIAAFVMIAAVIAIPLSGKIIHSRAAPSTVGSEPTWALPFPTGTSVYIGPLGLHDHNFRSMLDDSTRKVYTFTNPLDPDSLDFVLASQTPGGTSTTPTTAISSGTVLAVWAACQLVLVHHGNGWWGMYLHMANIQVTSGNTVSTGSIIGYPTTKKPTLKACGSVD